MKGGGDGCSMNNEAAHIRPLLPSLVSSLVSASNECNETTSEDHADLSSISTDRGEI